MFLIHIADNSLKINRMALRVHPGETTCQKIEVLHRIHIVMVHPHTPSAVGVLIGHMPFTHFSIYAYLNAICTKNALNMIIYCAKSFST